MRDGLRGLDGGEWFLVALGWGAGLAWALVSIGVGIQWWNAAAILVHRSSMVMHIRRRSVPMLLTSICSTYASCYMYRI